MLPLCAAVLAVGLAVPQKANADVATATVLGGAALLGTLMHSSQHYPAHYGAVGYPYAHPAPYAYGYPVAVAQPYAVPVYQPRPYYVYYPY